MHRHTFGVCMHVNNKIGECKNVTLAARTITGNIIMVINGKNWLAYDTSFLGFASNISEILAALADYTQAAAKQPIYIYINIFIHDTLTIGLLALTYGFVIVSLQSLMMAHTTFSSIHSCMCSCIETYGSYLFVIKNTTARFCFVFIEID